MAQAKQNSSKKKTTKAAPVQKSIPEVTASDASKRRIIAAVILLVIGLFSSISYFNNDGKVIAFMANIMKGIFGWGFILVPPCLLLCAYILGLHRDRPVVLRLVCAALMPLFFGTMLHIVGQRIDMASAKFFDITKLLYANGLEMHGGGVLGGLLAEGLRSAFSVYGGFPVALAAFIACLILSLRINLKAVASKLKEGGSSKPATAEKASAPRKKIPAVPSGTDIPLTEGDGEALGLDYIRYNDDEEIFTPSVKKQRGKAKPKTEELPAAETNKPEEDDGFVEFPIGKKPAPVTVQAAEIMDPPKAKKMKRSELDAQTETVGNEIAKNAEKAADAEEYNYPPVDLLRSGSIGSIDYREEVSVNRERLEGAIQSFGISAAIVGVTRGPTVTRYDVELDRGVKLARVTNLAGDLALALGVVNVRIAPIPDKISTVGIEVPNKIVSTVYLRDIIDSPKFQTAKSKLSFAIGKDIGGDCVVGNIAKLPHLLIAGTTGSGKSVCMNSLILSLLYKATPDEVRLIMIDPKMVELGIYNGLPHLFVPVVTDPKKAAGALQWSVVEMLKRYRLFSEVGVRDLTSYNEHCKQIGEDIIPQVVIVIDELADLMLVASKEVEESICRVAQMGRAAGMHLVIATQRPSADVITGLMKANIPSRIAFAVSSAMESRIILDQAGAEKLVGMGDMLFSPVGCGKPTRIQGAFVSDEEREEVVQFIKESASTVEQNSEIEVYMNKAAEDKKTADKPAGADDTGVAGNFDEMLPQAVEAVIEMKQCSVSMLQRRVKLGYARAARIVDQMEELGIVGPYEGAKPRSVLIDSAGWHTLQLRLGMITDDSVTDIYNEDGFEEN